MILVHLGEKTNTDSAVYKILCKGIYVALLRKTAISTVHPQNVRFQNVRFQNVWF